MPPKGRKGGKKGGKKGRGKGKKGAAKKGGVADGPPPKEIVNELRQQYALECTRRGVEPMKSLLDVIDNCISEDVWLYQIIIHDAGFDSSNLAGLCAALGSYKRLKHLCLWRSRLEDEDGLRALSDFVLQDTVLLTLELNDCHVSPSGCRHVSNALSSNSTLKTLILDHNEFGNEGMEELGSGVAANAGLETLSMKYCNLGPEAIPSLGKLLQRTALKTVDLHGNMLQTLGAIELFRSLSGCTSIEKLILSDCGIGDALLDQRMFKELNASLKTCTTLKSLNLGENFFGDAAAHLLAGVVKENKSIIDIDVPITLSTAVFKEVLAETGSNKRLVRPVKRAGAKGRKGGKKGKKGKKKRK